MVGYEQVVLAELGYGTAYPGQAGIMTELRRNGVRLADNILTERRARPLAARDRLVERLARALA